MSLFNLFPLYFYNTSVSVTFLFSLFLLYLVHCIALFVSLVLFLFLLFFLHCIAFFHLLYIVYRFSLYLLQPISDYQLQSLIPHPKLVSDPPITPAPPTLLQSSLLFVTYLPFCAHCCDMYTLMCDPNVTQFPRPSPRQSLTPLTNTRDQF